MSVADLKSPSVTYSWHLVGVLEYNREKKLYLVQKADRNGRVRDSKGKPILKSKERPKGKAKALILAMYFVFVYLSGPCQVALNYTCMFLSLFLT